MAKRYELLKDMPDEIVFKRYLNSAYYISTTGMVYSSKQNKILRGDRRNGYLIFDLWIDGYAVSKSQHRLLAECFIPNPNNLPIVRHLDDNPYNISLDNLAWGTKSDNGLDASLNGRYDNRLSPAGSKHRSAKLTEEAVIQFRKEFDSGVHYKELSNKYNVSPATAYKIGNRQSWKHLN